VADVTGLLALLTLEPVADGVHRPIYYPPDGPGFVFGGQLLAQAMCAASATVGPDRAPHSLHAHFLAAGRPGRELTYHVEPLRDGGSFSARRVTAVQDDSAVFVGTVSFNRARPTDGLADYRVPAPPAPQPDDEHHRWTPVMGGLGLFSAFDLREMPPPEPAPDGTFAYTRRLWWRTAGELPDDPALHAAVFAFASDFGVTIASSVTAGLYGRAEVQTSLDHGLWLHRPVRADRWVLMDLVPVSNAASRGFVRGSLFGADGTLVASLAQETLVC
jgi:acyl-CoA thioesterase-2